MRARQVDEIISEFSSNSFETDSLGDIEPPTLVNSRAPVQPALVRTSARNPVAARILVANESESSDGRIDSDSDFNLEERSPTPRPQGSSSMSLPVAPVVQNSIQDCPSF